MVVRYQCVPRGGLANYPGTTTYPLKTQETTNYGTTYRFQEDHAADGTSFAPFGPCKSTRQFPSSETNYSTINTGTGCAPTQTKRGRPYHKPIAIVFASHRLQLGDNQGPNADDVGDNVHKMRHIKSLVRKAFFRAG